MPGEAGFDRIVGAEHVRIPAGEALDGVPVRRVVRPANADQVGACLALAREGHVALIVSGGGTKLAWGNRCDAPGLVRLELGRLDQVVDLDADEGVATVEAGIGVAVLSNHAEPHGLTTLLDTSHAGGTVGGSIATEAFGPEFSLDRRARDELLGLEVALPDGSLTHAGGRVIKNVTGFDLVRLYCGSFGTLGVITRATLRLRPLPARREVHVVELAGFGAALERARELVERGVDAQGVAARPCAERVELIWLLEGSETDVAERARRSAGERRDAAEWEGVRRARVADPAAPPDEGRARVRLFGRPSDTLGMIGAVERAAGRGALRLALPAAGVVFAEPAEEALEAMLEAAVRGPYGALVERASAAWKAGHDVFGAPPDSLALMRALKARFDPERVLAPGRFVAGV